MISPETAIKQLKALERAGKELRLAADGWDEDWKTLVSTILSARTTDVKSIDVSNNLYKKYKNVRELSHASLGDVKRIVNPVNFYKTKARNIIACAKMIVSVYHGKVPHDFEKLVELPGVGRKTANVFLAEKGQGRIGIDTHVFYASHYLGWTKGKKQEEVEKDLEKLFPRARWKDINWILVRFGQSYKSRIKKDKILDEIRRIK